MTPEAIQRPKTGRPKGADHKKFSDLSNPWQRVRSHLNLSQFELGKLLEICQQTIAQYEGGKRFPHPFYAKRFVMLCKARRVRCSLDEVYEAMPVD